MIDHVARLTINELSEGSRLMGADLLYCINEPGHVKRYDALAVAAWLIERKADRTVKLDTYRAMLAHELMDYLVTVEDSDTDEPDDELEDQGAADPLVSPDSPTLS